MQCEAPSPLSTRRSTEGSLFELGPWRPQTTGLVPEKPTCASVGGMSSSVDPSYDTEVGDGSGATIGGSRERLVRPR